MSLLEMEFEILSLDIIDAGIAFLLIGDGRQAGVPPATFHLCAGKLFVFLQGEDDGKRFVPGCHEDGVAVFHCIQNVPGAGMEDGTVNLGEC